jgi:superfamily II DNA/RNA helicase
VNIVAIYNLDKDKETLAGTLATVLNVSLYDVLMRLRVPGNGPLTVAVFAQKERAEELAEKLQSAGFAALVLTGTDIEAAAMTRVVKRFVLGTRELRVGTEKGDFSLSFQDVDLILCGMSITRSTETETVKERSVSPGRAVLSGGMMLTKTTKTTREVTTDERERFLNLYSGNNPTIVLRENALDYNSLGPARKLSRSENFTYLAAELRRYCTGARYDERLVNRAAQAALLGPLLDPEKNLVVSTSLLAKALRKKV